MASRETLARQSLRSDRRVSPFPAVVQVAVTSLLELGDEASRIEVDCCP